MNLPELKALAELQKHRKAHINREKGSIYYHGQRVANTVLQLRRAILPNDESHDDILSVAAWFHDIGKDIEPHAHTGAILVRDLLQAHCASEELEEICGLIALHCDRRPNDNKHSAYVKLLQDADLLDHFGVMAVWWSIMWSAHEDESPARNLDYFEREWQPFCKKHRALLNYPQSIAAYDEKITFEQEFFARFRLEAQGDLVSTSNI